MPTYVKPLEEAVLPLASSYYTTIVLGGIPADILPVKVFALDTLTKVVHWSPCGY